MKNRKKRYVIAITGASGIAFGIDLLSKLALADCEIYCVLTAAAKDVMGRELGGAQTVFQAMDALRLSGFWKIPPLPLSKKEISRISTFEDGDFDAPIASGSFLFDAMAVSPCSMKTLGKIANSIADTLAVRAAEVAIKERRRLVIVPRETPLALTSMRNMCAVSEAGAVVLPPSPGFYSRPACVGDIIEFVTARTLSAMGAEQSILKEWGYESL